MSLRLCLAVSHGRVQIGLNQHLVQRLWMAKINEHENWAMRGRECVAHLQDGTVRRAEGPGGDPGRTEQINMYTGHFLSPIFKSSDMFLFLKFESSNRCCK